MSVTPSLRKAAPQPATPCTAPPFRGRVLVLAPHPDDETIGPGATLALHHALGDPIAVLYVTTGVHGDPTGRHAPDAYVAVRRAEARAAAAVLGVAHTEFWEYPDNCEVSEDDLRAVTERLVDVVNRWRPDVVYAPHPGETHSDHYFVALAAARAASVAEHPFALLGYEVWEALQARWAVDVASSYDTKLAAIACYASQTEHTDIVRCVEGLNRFRSVLLPGKGRWAEVFVPFGAGDLPDATV